ncbi:MAG: nucleotidyltransferase [Chloroflexi bacterium]|nr:MAG: nucleotidyltransferase [Chloroflexota bacterium]
MRRVLTLEEILRKIEENIDKIKRFGVKRIGLFGSYVRGEQGAESDVDIVVEFEKGKATLDNFLDLTEYLEKFLGKKIDLLTIDGVKSIRIDHIRKEIEESVIYVS